MSKRKSTNKKETSNPKPEVKPEVKTKERDIGIGRATVISAIILATGGILAAIIGFGGEVFSIYAPEPTQHVPVSVEPTNTVELPATPNGVETPTSITAAPTLELPLLVLQPTENDLKNIPIINVGYQDILFPGENTYQPKISSKRTYLWTFLWCSKFESTLEENLNEINFLFFINDIQLEETNFLIFREPSVDGWPCQRWTTILGKWDKSAPPTLSVVYNISFPLSDGARNYDIGEYRHELNLVFVD